MPSQFEAADDLLQSGGAAFAGLPVGLMLRLRGPPTVALGLVVGVSALLSASMGGRQPCWA